MKHFPSSEIYGLAWGFSLFCFFFPSPDLYCMFLWHQKKESVNDLTVKIKKKDWFDEKWWIISLSFIGKRWGAPAGWSGASEWVMKAACWDFLIVSEGTALTGSLSTCFCIVTNLCLWFSAITQELWPAGPNRVIRTHSTGSTMNIFPNVTNYTHLLLLKVLWFVLVESSASLPRSFALVPGPSHSSL